MSRDPRDRNLSDWTPRTKLGRLVQSGEVTTMMQAVETGLPLREPEIVDMLMPDLEDDVVDVNMVQRMTDSGRRVRFRVAAVVGNEDGLVGLGQAKGREVGPTIRRAIDNAKLSIIPVRRGRIAWEIDTDIPHTVPFASTGKVASVEVTLKPAPRGVGLAAGDVAKQVLRMAGIRDVFCYTSGQTRTTINFAKATFEALRETSRTRITPANKERLKIQKGPAIQAARSPGEPQGEEPVEVAPEGGATQ